MGAAKKVRDALVRIPGVQPAIQAAASRGIVPRSVWGRLQPIGWRIIRAPSGARLTYVSAPDDVMARTIVWTHLRDWEVVSQSVLAQLARDSHCFVDAGAYAGIYTLLACAANQDLRAVAIEPNPLTLPKLRANIAANALTGRVEVAPYALGDEPREATFYASKANATASSLLSLDGQAVTVEVKRGDDILAGRWVDLMKVDVEGFELQALRGMARTLGQHHPSVIIECLGDETFPAVREELARHDYGHFYYLSPDGVVDTATGYRKVKGHPNFLCRAEPFTPVP
jgi:FkbM family methyltransferase